MANSVKLGGVHHVWLREKAGKMWLIFGSRHVAADSFSGLPTVFKLYFSILQIQKT